LRCYVLVCLLLALQLGVCRAGQPLLRVAAQEGGARAEAAVPASAADALLARADAQFDAGRYQEALTLYQQAADAAGGQLSQSIILSHRIGRTLLKLRHLDLAQAAYERAIALVARSSPLIQSHLEPVLRQAQGEVLRAMGRPQRARAEYQRALDGYAALNKNTDVARMQAEIGSTFVDEANFSEALKNYEAARQRMEASHAPELGQLLINTSSLMTWLGKYDAALALQEQAGRACEARRDAGCRAAVAHVQGFTQFQLGDYERAAAAARNAVQSFGPLPSVERARALNNLGLSLVALHQPQDGLKALRESLTLLENTGATTKDKATTIDSIGTAYRSMGDLKRAKVLYLDALLRWRSAGHREGERDTLANLGQLATDTKQPEAAIFYYKLSVNLAQSLRANARQLEAGYLDSVTRRLTPSYQILTSLLVDQGRFAEAQQVIRMLKEQELFDFLRRGGPAGDTTATLNGPEQGQFAAYEAIQARVFLQAKEYDDLNRKPPALRSDADRARREQLDGLVSGAQQELEKFVVNLNAALAKEGRVTAAAANANLASLHTTLQRLGRGAVVLQYVSLEDHLEIILIGPHVGGEQGYRVPVASKDLNQMAWKFRTQIEALSPDAKITGRALYELLMPTRLRRDLTDVQAKILMVSLDGALRYLPFAALHDGNKWLVERYAIAIHTAAAGLNLGNVPQARWSMRAFGVTQSVGGLPALPWVRTELRAIVGAKGMPGEMVFDADFTEDRLRDAVFQSHPPVLHIASHFIFHADTEDESYLLLGVGRLTLTAIKRLTFTQVELLTLSACDTAKGGGTNSNGREIEGFAALAQQGGADAVLATLWQVADISTAAFMQAFYQSRQSVPGRTKVEAMQEVQIAMIRGHITTETAQVATGARGSVEGNTTPVPGDYKQPYFWAPFVLYGNWL
jgi:CHAT domain-containing protein/predicted negative regulator of RcsB-dependent stress response